MRQSWWLGIVFALLCGCASGPLQDNPMLVNPLTAAAEGEKNPVYIPPHAYATVFENTLRAVQDAGFEILESNRYDGRIESLPRTSPGIGQPFKAGSPALNERLLATCQSYRNRASVKIHPADDGGFFIQVIVYKELEDLPAPVRATAGGAIFRNDNNVERKFEVIDPTLFETNWIPRGRDLDMEQAILRRLRDCM